MAVKLQWGQQRIRWGHPLAKGLVGSWLFNEKNGYNAFSGVHAQDTIALSNVLATNGPFWSYGVGPNSSWGYDFRDGGTSGNHATAILSAPSSHLQPANTVTLFWRGAVRGAQNGSNNPSLAYLTYDNANSSPYVAYGITRLATAASLDFMDDAGGTFTAQTVASIIPGGGNAWSGIFDAAFTFRNGGKATGYVNGRQVCSASRSGALSYAASCQLRLNCDFTVGEYANTQVDVLYIWNRELSAPEISLLHARPYAFLVQAEQIVRPKATAAPAGLIVVPPVDYQPFLAQ